MMPRCHTAGGLQQLRYQLPYDIASSVTYPLTSSNGSTILLCGHSAGLFVLWRGGRRLKPAKALADPTPAQDVMTIDDSDDGHPSTEGLTPPDFEDEEGEFDPHNPYLPIVQTLDLPLNTGVLQVSIPQLSEAERRHLRPKLLQGSILVALACTDSSIRVMTLPLDPPSEVSKSRKSLVANPRLAYAGQGSWDEQVITALGQRTLPTALSIAIAPRSLVIENDEDLQDNSDLEDAWDVLVASGSADIGGTLLVHRIAVEDDGTRLADDSLELWRNVLLRTLPTSLDLCVGPDVASGIYPKVIVAEADQPVRIYECSSEESREEGKWLANLHTSSAKTSPYILDVKFALAGKLALALTKNGDWGVWNLATASGIKITDEPKTIEKFSYKGSLATSPSLMSSGKAATTQQPQLKALPAVTPHTRKVRQQALFEGEGSKVGTDSTTGFTTSLRGGISLTKLSHESGTGEDSALLVWYSDRALFIHSLRAHHTKRTAANENDPSTALVSRDDPFGAPSGVGAGAHIRNLVVPDRSRLNGGAQLAIWAMPSTVNRAPSVRSKVPDVVYVSERAISFVGPPKTDDGKRRDRLNGTFAREAESDISMLGSRSLLQRGELSLEGVEGMLDRMAGGVRRLSGRA